MLVFSLITFLRQFSFHRNQPFANTNVTNSFSYIQEDTIMITNNQEKENQNANQSTNTAMPQSEPNKADSVDLSSALPRAALDEIPECKADAVSITGLVKKSGRVAGYQLSDNRIVSREEGVSLAKAGEALAILGLREIPNMKEPTKDELEFALKKEQYQPVILGYKSIE